MPQISQKSDSISSAAAPAAEFNKRVDTERRSCHKKLRKFRNFCASSDSLACRWRRSASGHDMRYAKMKMKKAKETAHD